MAKLDKRTFSSYGPVSPDTNYYSPRTALVATIKEQLVGKTPEEGGHFFTVWAPRQTGKSWAVRQVVWDMQSDDRFLAVKVNLESLKSITDNIIGANGII